VLSGVYKATAGEVRLGDDVLTGLKPHKIASLGVARAFQNLGLFTGASVEENLLVGRHHLMRGGFLSGALLLPSVRREERIHRERVREIAEFLGIDRLLDLPVGDLPYGDRKRVELARALCMEPRILLLDEPVAGMNAEETRRIGQAIRSIRRALGISIVLVEHDMSFVMSLADRVSVLDFGRCVADGTPAEVREHPEVIRAYLGEVSDDNASQNDRED
jgi:branched-chain amino acid transport system ATP-binding protein